MKTIRIVRRKRFALIVYGFVVVSLILFPPFRFASGQNSELPTNGKLVSGTAWSWGHNVGGCLGDGTKTDRLVPVQALEINDVIAVFGGCESTVALKTDGTVWGWGNNWGDLLEGDNQLDYPLPRRIKGLSDVATISRGYSGAITLAVKRDGTVWAWTDRDMIDRKIKQVDGLSDVVAVAAGDFHALALKSDGTVWAWGSNMSGRLGDGTGIDRERPVQVANLSDVIGVAVADTSSLALKSDGTVWVWGEKLGYDSIQMYSSPTRVEGLNDVAAIAAGGSHALALKKDGSVWAWGNNEHGTLGNGSRRNSRVPIKVGGMNNVVAIAAGLSHSLALKSDGTIWAWGYNFAGALGDGSIREHLIPVPVKGIKDAVGIGLGENYSLAIRRGDAQASSPVASSYPDLVVHSIGLDKSNYRPGEEGTATIVIKNQSNTPTTGNCVIALFRHGADTANINFNKAYKIAPCPPLAGGATQTVVVSFVNFVAVGNYQLRVYVDATCVVPEINETNNHATTDCRVVLPTMPPPTDRGTPSNAGSPTHQFAP